MENSIILLQFVCTLLNGFKYRKRLNISIWSINETLTGTTNPSEPDSDYDEEVLHIPQSSKTRALPSDSLVSYQDPRWEWVSYRSTEVQSTHSTNNMHTVEWFQITNYNNSL